LPAKNGPSSLHSDDYKPVIQNGTMHEAIKPQGSADAMRTERWKMKRLFTWLGLSAVTTAFAAGTRWPDLPQAGFVVGRVATPADVKAGRAAFFLLDKNGRTISKPASVVIPQYGLHVTGGAEVPVIIIQAEDAPMGTTIGYKYVGQEKLGVCLLAEVKLLGKKKPG
jgi:hypothetical protein